MTDEVIIARRHVERLADIDGERFGAVVADGLSVCQEVLQQGVGGAEDLSIRDGDEDGTLAITLPDGNELEAFVSDVEKMLQIERPVEALAAIIALMPSKVIGQGW